MQIYAFRKRISLIYVYSWTKISIELRKVFQERIPRMQCHLNIYLSIYIYIYIERERERESEHVYGLDGPRIEYRYGTNFPHTSISAQPASYTMGTESLSRG